MLKRLIGVLLALMLFVGSVGAFAAETEEVAAPSDVTIKVVDMLAEPMSGIVVTVTDLENLPVTNYITDETGERVLEKLEAGSYLVKAYDSTDGYSTQEWITVPDQPTLTLTLRKLVEGSEITVGNVTKVNGSFFTDMWGNNTSDIDVRAMLHAYQTVAWDNNLTAVLDESVVTVESITESPFGDRTYTFNVNPNLTYNDGTPIDARDYVFSILLQSSPQAVANGAMAYGYSHLIGFEDYNEGAEEFFSGVRLLSNTQFSMTVSSDYLPYYYELVYLNAQPYPMSVLVPGCEVADDGDGALIRPLYDEQGNPLGEFTAEVLAQTIFDPVTGYMSHPKMTSGPYSLVSYDADSGKVEFVANLNYLGNFEGQRPLIEKVTLVVSEKTTMLDDLVADKVDILNKITDAEAINAAMTLRDQETPEAQVTTYLRSGQAFLGLACEQGPTSYARVRQAISHCLDLQTITTEYTGTYGLPVYSHYGLGQWMAANYVNTMQDEVTTYDYDIEAAKALLVRDGWRFNEEGKTFREGEDTVRYRRLNQKELNAYRAVENPIVEYVRIGNSWYLPLELKYASVTNSGLCAKVEELLLPRLEEIGFRIVKQEIGFTEMLRCYYRQDERTFNLFALASNFTFVYDPYFEFSGDEIYQGTANRSGINDRTLSRLALQLRQTQPDDTETYIARWLELMKQYSEVLPTVPIYSNMYVDIEDTDVQDYNPNSSWSWPVAILYTWLGEPEEVVTFGEDAEVSTPFGEPAQP